MPGEQGGDVLSGHAVQVQMNVRWPFERGLGIGERVSGPRHPAEREHGSRERGYGAGRALLAVAVPPVPCQNSHTGSELVFSAVIRLLCGTR
jgi:hypothetical protein